MNGHLLLGSTYAVVGLALVCWAKPLSMRYNAWTTGLRERHPNINPPPTPEWRARNTKIMTVMFRVFGVFLLLLSTVEFLTYLAASPNYTEIQNRTGRITGFRVFRLHPGRAVSAG
jgi:hypothetical protein